MMGMQPGAGRIAGAARRVLLLAAVVAAAVAMPLAAQAQSLMTEQAARTMLEETYGVEVLRIRADYRDETDVFVASVMNPGGDFNEAFQVTRLIVDRVTGDLTSQFRHGASGVRSGGDRRRDTAENSGPVLRRDSLR